MSLQLSGLVGGFVATVVMTGFMLAFGNDSPPTAMLVAEFAGGDPEDYLLHGMVLHLLYGTGAGWVFSLLGASGLVAILSLDTLVGGLVNGLVYGLLLMAVAVVWFRGVIGMDPDPRKMGLMVGFHLVYGAVLGAFVGFGVLV